MLCNTIYKEKLASGTTFYCINLKGMGKIFLKSLITTIIGCLLGLVITGVVLYLGWDAEGKDRILIFGYGALVTLTVWFVNAMAQLKGKDIKALEALIEKKADKAEVANLSKILDNMEKKIDAITDFLIKRN